MAFSPLVSLLSAYFVKQGANCISNHKKACYRPHYESTSD
jgi:hypothetical protein